MQKRRPWGRIVAVLAVTSGLALVSMALMTDGHVAKENWKRAHEEPQHELLEHRIVASQANEDPVQQDVPGTASALQVFEVDTPILGPAGKVVGAGRPGAIDVTTNVGASPDAAACQVTLMVNSFGNSFGIPFVGNYTPPACLGDSNTVVMNLTVQSIGTQFDRLSIM